MTKFVQDRDTKTEAGGVLLGRFIIGCDDVVVDAVTIPMKGDKRSKFHFFRSAQYHQKRIQKAWQFSDGVCNYLGEWHTHPESDPSPSLHDTLEWKRKLRFDKYDSDFLFFVIVGTKQINIWKGHRRKISLEKLIRIR
jgi:integrative and conjugative element protein (TIGR02256 family)